MPNIHLDLKVLNSQVPLVMTTTLPQRNGHAVLDPFAPIASDLAAAERILRQTLETAQPGVAKLLEHLTHYRGKGLRPALLLLVAHAAGEVTTAHHTLAAVVEMIHTATLVHDDVLDAADVRRHVPTINARWGNQASILLGDYLFTHAFHLTSTLGQAQACQLIGQATNQVCAGELHQICQRGNLDLTENEYFQIIDGKTAALTACCCRLGALYAGLDPDAVESLAAYGRNLGLAFQIADDVLDMVGSERAAGKSLGTDLAQHKLTLPLIYLLAGLPATQRQAFRRLLEANQLGRSELGEALHTSGALAAARHRAEDLAAEAAVNLECLAPSSARDILHLLTQRVVHRDA